MILLPKKFGLKYKLRSKEKGRHEISQNRRHRTRRKEKTKNKKEVTSLWLLICLPEETEAWGFPEKSSRIECTKLYVFAELEPMAVAIACKLLLGGKGLVKISWCLMHYILFGFSMLILFI